MVSQQGSLDLLHTSIAQELLHSNIPVRLAYVWSDGTPRVVPIAFHWDGQDIVVATPADAPKVKVIDREKVAVTIDSNDAPWKVLMVRGTAQVTIVQGIVPEYVLAVKRYMGEEGGDAWIKQVTPLFPQMARIAIRPEWVGMLDFEQRFPSAIEKAMAGYS